MLVDGTSVGTATPNSTSYASYQTSTFTVPSATCSIEFQGSSPVGGDNTAFVDEVVISPVVNGLADGSFETPEQPTKTFQYVPSGSPWQFSGGAGVTSNQSAFFGSANSVAPDGVQVAFIQGTGSMSQATYLDAGTYSLSFQAAQRAGSYQAHYQEIAITVDGTPYGEVTPASTSYGLCQSLNFTVGAGVHTICLTGVNPQGGDNTAFVDEALISPLTDAINDGSFEAPGLPVETFQYSPNGSAWQFSGAAGVASDKSAFTTSNPNAPDGLQAGFLQGQGTMSQTVYLAAGAYSISLQAAQRGGSWQTGNQTIKVLLGSEQIGLITPSSTSFALYQTSGFSVSAGQYTISLAGADAQGDSTAILDEVTISPVTDSISDGSFETPALTANTSAYSPGGSQWQFSGAAGVATNGSAFTSANPDAPDGSQVAFIQNKGSISQLVYLYSDTYTISFEAAQREVAGKAQSQVIEVVIDPDQADQVVGYVTPLSTSYGQYQTLNFTVSVGMHTISLVGLNPQGGDNTALVDDVTVSPASDAISDGNFETPGEAAETFYYTPNGSPWQFSGSAGVTANDSAFTSHNPDAPVGNEVAFLQGTGSMTQDVSLDAGTYALSFQAAQREVSSEANSQEIQVSVNGSPVATITPVDTSYGTYQTSDFTVGTGVQIITFAAVNPEGGDNTALVDDVTLLPPANLITDGSFERPGLAANSFEYTPDGSAWQFNGQAGISSNGSTITSANPNAPDGSQIAFIQGNGDISQTVTLSAGTYSLNFQAAQRGCRAGPLPVAGGPARRRTSVHGDSQRHQLCPLPDTDFHGARRHSHHRVAGPGSGGRRQHGLG